MFVIALFPNCAFLSETSRMLAIARALRARGERVVIASHGGPFESVLEAAGETVAPLTPRMDPERSAAFVRAVITLGDRGTATYSVDELRESVASEAALLRSCRARMVVTGFTLSAYLSSRVVGIPLATSHGGSWVPPVFERKLAGAPTQAPAPALDWLPSFVTRWLANTIPPRLTHPTAMLNVVARELGVATVHGLTALMVGDLTMVTDVPSVLGISDAEMSAWRPTGKKAYAPSTRLRYTGPLVAQLDAEVPARVRAWLDEDVPTAYVALNSTTSAFIRRVVTGVRAAGLRVIVSSTIHDLSDIASADVIVADLLPSHRIVPHVDIAVIMGGQGSVQTAMLSGTPFVAFPLHLEQEFNVSLGVRQGMGIALSVRRSTESHVCAAVHAILANPSYRAAAKRVQSLYAGADGAAGAARAIVDYLAETATSPRV